ncbi:twin-arginine translocation pathway signal protein [Labrys okinawensis]|uniref:Twin-arginine translocation pathway signal protein n=1 Tax=Labrys okinawensis TaxID=346911 RepID=A0A2S9QG37_9HYPH|nr:FAD-dependent oxidoreductase [Labrys okinawensis]PRH88294.1 twin-arginine translocation pathway signal protein [Labrys okinawensis]
MTRISRKQFLALGAASLGLAGAGLVGGELLAGKALPGGGGGGSLPGDLVGASSRIGHRLRNGSFPVAGEIRKTGVVIVGGGIAGLGAGYRLAKAGYDDFLLLDLEASPGGNAASGRNEVCAFPWGAHYVPLLTEEARAVRALFQDFGIITGYDAKGTAIYDDYALCADPSERLYRYGRWQEGLMPAIGLEADEEADGKRFFAAMKTFRQRIGRDGRRAFAIPLDLSSQDADLMALDGITMTAWMEKEGYRSPSLAWYVDYCCRDDYGARAQDVSAWAGIHYFAARNGRGADADDQGLVTWPEGNGYLARRLAEALGSRIRTQSLAYAVEEKGNGVAGNAGVTVDVWDAAADKAFRIEARAAILATPHFVSARLMRDPGRAAGFSYAPWAVANITLGRLPGGVGASLAWDNVVFDSPLLGYVVATHQIPQMRPTKTVLTYYWPLSHLPPAEARREALARPLNEWQAIFLKELLAVHPELEGHVERADVWIWGHAMVRPVPGFIWGPQRRAGLNQKPPLFTAHSDMSGISIFEEAYTHGVRAAENAMAYTGHRYVTVL